MIILNFIQWTALAMTLCTIILDGLPLDFGNFRFLSFPLDFYFPFAFFFVFPFVVVTFTEHHSAHKNISDVSAFDRWACRTHNMPLSVASIPVSFDSSGVAGSWTYSCGSTNPVGIFHKLYLTSGPLNTQLLDDDHFGRIVGI